MGSPPQPAAAAARKPVAAVVVPKLAAALGPQPVPGRRTPPLGVAVLQPSNPNAMKRRCAKTSKGTHLDSHPLVCGRKRAKAAPKSTETWPAEEQRFWTYLAAPAAEPGEYVYELTLYPTCHWKSSIRYEAGTGVVLQRGILRIVAETQ